MTVHIIHLAHSADGLLGEHWLFLLAYPGLNVLLQHVNSLLHPKTLFVLFPKLDPPLVLVWLRRPARLVYIRLHRRLNSLCG